VSRRVRHLVARFREMGLPVTTEDDDTRFAARILSPTEMRLWASMDAFDRRHSVDVTRRFIAQLPGASRDETAAALLHDVGKSTVRLGRIGRSIATLVPLTATMRRYRDHERIGADMLRDAGVNGRTIELVSGAANDEVARRLRSADDGDG